MKISHIALASALLVSSSVAAFGQAFSDKDKSFLKDSAEGNLAEVKTAQLVLKTSKNADVRGFAEMMVKDHTALYDGEKPVAAKAGVTLPTSPSAMQDAEYLKLKVLTGETFDKSYVKMMVADHKDDLEKGQAENSTTANPDMKKLSGHAGTVIAAHKAKIDAIAGKMGVQ
jgi:putative membrane protein